MTVYTESEQQRCLKCGAIHKLRDLQEDATCTFAETRLEPAEYEWRCDCGHTEFEDYWPCESCGEAERSDDDDFCAKCADLTERGLL